MRRHRAVDEAAVPSGPSWQRAVERRAGLDCGRLGGVSAPRVLLAFDKFKGALTAEQACGVAAEALRSAWPAAVLDVAPLSDGGDGFCRIATLAAGGELRAHAVAGPRFGEHGRAFVDAPIGIVEVSRLEPAVRDLLALPAAAERVAIVDLASASGLALVPRAERNVWRSSTLGTGELLRAAAGLGVEAVLLGLGGSATSDLGLGALCALGLHFVGPEGELAPPLPADWPRVTAIEGALSPLPPLSLACDVDAPLFGPLGAAAVYGPQKGLPAAELARFEAEAQRLAALLCRRLGVGLELASTPGAGAAGGIAFALMAAYGARSVPGSELMSAWLGLEARARDADWVLTGEGRFDASSLAGKGPGAILALARRLGRGCAVFAGSLARGELGEIGAAQLIALSRPGQPLSEALPRTERALREAVTAWARSLRGR